MTSLSKHKLKLPKHKSTRKSLESQNTLHQIVLQHTRPFIFDESLNEFYPLFCPLCKIRQIQFDQKTCSFCLSIIKRKNIHFFSDFETNSFSFLNHLKQRNAEAQLLLQISSTPQHPPIIPKPSITPAASIQSGNNSTRKNSRTPSTVNPRKDLLTKIQKTIDKRRKPTKTSPISASNMIKVSYPKTVPNPSNSTVVTCPTIKNPSDVQPGCSFWSANN